MTLTYFLVPKVSKTIIWSTRFIFIRNMFIRNLHVESSKTKKLLLLHSISISEIRNLFFFYVNN